MALTCAVVPECVRAMHRQYSYSSCEVLCGSVLAVDGEWILVAALVKQNAMVLLRQLLNTRGKSTRGWHATPNPNPNPRPCSRASRLCTAGFRAMAIVCRAHRLL